MQICTTVLLPWLAKIMAKLKNKSDINKKNVILSLGQMMFPKGKIELI